VQREFEDYLRCGRLEHGFLRVRCESCHAEHLVAFSCYLELKTIRSPRGGRRRREGQGLSSCGLGCSRPLNYFR
jgi:ribosomal protein S27E